MAIERRTFLAGLVSLLGLPAATANGAASASAIIAANTRMPDGSYAAVLQDLDRGLLRRVALPGRGHDVTYDPVNRVCIAFARRPGNFAVAFGIDGRTQPIAFTTPPGRHFYGHGVVSRDGRILFTTENDFEAGTGVIGMWDLTAGFRRIGEVPSHGIGPHDINLLSDGRTLVIANGGIATHPDSGRTPLNLATMQPSLAYVDAGTGDLLERHTLSPGLSRLSIRHLEVAADDVVVFGCQYKGARTDAVDLLGMHRRGEQVRLIKSSAEVRRALRHYVSSIAVDRNGELAAFSSSRGQQVVIVDIGQGAVVAIKSLADVSGVAAGPRPGQFVLTSGNGDLLPVSTRKADAGPTGQKFRWNWDNHAMSILR